jgi:hypothetical protein
MPMYYGVVLHTFVRVLTKIRQKWHPLIKLYRSVCINCNELLRVRVMIEKVHMWAPLAPVSLSVSSKTFKHKTKFSHILSDNSKRPYFIHRFCDEYSTVAAMDLPLLRKLWPVWFHGTIKI